ncbi:hypothetical protein AB0K60_02475 [Thermopolyspora sp. NPDC052614]|uniref:hypothetical protein n=1 Tax=Thermopolyspora sp. NPDC052614 TaxID=3155682 RepID=UPI0034294F78
MSRRIFREQALRRHAGRAERSPAPEPGAVRFVVLWLMVALLVAVLALLVWPLLGSGGSPGAGVGVPGGGR